jgi:hypothetical protein
MLYAWAGQHAAALRQYQNARACSKKNWERCPTQKPPLHEAIRTKQLRRRQ